MTNGTGFMNGGVRCIRRHREGTFMARPEVPATTAVRFLTAHAIPFEPLFYKYEEHGGTGRASSELHVSEHQVIKTLVFETEARKPLLVLMHGDCEVSTKQLARVLGTKHVVPCDASTAQRHTGYMVGGISPFGTRTSLLVYVEATILSLPEIYINGGKRGFLVAVNPRVVQEHLASTPVNVAIPETRSL
jgi:Cys-tRNA(Pro) deacylase